MTLNSLPNLTAPNVVAATRAAMVAAGTMTPSSSEIEAGFNEAHLFSANVASDFALGTTVLTYWRQRPLSIPERAAYRSVYFAAWVDGLSAWQVQGQILFSLRGSAVFALPFKLRREAASLSNSYGWSFGAFDVWRLAGTDSDFIVPAAGDAGIDALVLADTGAAYRYQTTMHPRRVAITADRAEIQIADWQISSETNAAGMMHLAVASQSRPL